MKTVGMLSPGYAEVPPGHVANVVTCLEMFERPQSRSPVDFSPPDILQRMDRGDLGAYRALYRLVVQDLLWWSRLMMPDSELSAILADTDVELFAPRRNNRDIGILELDFRAGEECELAFFGLVPDAIGGGLGRALMKQALTRAWDRPIRRLWVHTCTFDHPGAFDFYVRSSFTPYAFEVEVHPDPRLSGILPRDAAQQVPLLDPDAPTIGCWPLRFGA
ncbi:MAG: GNAT family N-acetyltransferase [Rhodospirillaceae bacterium]|nr:GNAT family N-acetyltransferase [Rhodospirillaceae bacterium]